MKKIQLIYISFLTLIAVGCSDSFLDISPVGKSFEITYYGTESEVMKGLNAAYDLLVYDYSAQNSYGSSYMTRSIASDEGACGGAYNDMAHWQEVDEYRCLPSNEGLKMLWKRNYFGIYRCNKLISKKFEDDPEATDTTLRAVAEAKFLRAYYYWELVNFFGSVPIVDENLTTADPFPAQETVAKIHEYIQTDLKYAINNLPEKSEYTPEDYHRASAGAARALLAKSYIFEEKWTEASITLMDLFDSHEYSLDSSYAHVFSMKGEFGVESIFEINYANTYGSNWEQERGIVGNVNSQLMGVRDLQDNPYYYKGWGFNKVELGLVNAFLSENDSIRLNASAYNPTQMGLTYNDPNKKTGWWCKKMAPSKDSGTDGDGALELDFAANERVMRLADMYLLYAETQFRLGNEDICRDYIDSVRHRVNLPDIDPLLTGANLFSALVNERRLELAMEGHRYWDLIRWGLAETTLVNQPGAEPLGSFKAPKNNVFPIPQQEIDRSGGVLKQNLDY